MLQVLLALGLPLMACAFHTAPSPLFFHGSRLATGISRRGALHTATIMAASQKPAFRGFGSVPDSFKDRTPKSSDEQCACCSEKTYADCCQPYHTGKAWPPNPLALMRSRYSAYAYRLPDWIMGTTHKTNVDWKADKAKWKRELTGFCDGFDFLGLQVVAESAGADANEAFVEFVAKLRTCNQPRQSTKEVQGVIRTIKSRNGADYVDADFRERSRFLCEDGKWMYAAGDVDFDPQVELEGATVKVAGNKAQEK